MLPNSPDPNSTGLAVDPKSYVIGPEDILDYDFSRAGTERRRGVRPDGKITRPLIGDMQAAGLTPERLAAKLKEAYQGKSAIRK